MGGKVEKRVGKRFRRVEKRIRRKGIELEEDGLTKQTLTYRQITFLR